MFQAYRHSTLFYPWSYCWWDLLYELNTYLRHACRHLYETSFLSPFFQTSCLPRSRCYFLIFFFTTLSLFDGGVLRYQITLAMWHIIWSLVYYIYSLSLLYAPQLLTVITWHWGLALLRLDNVRVNISQANELNFAFLGYLTYSKNNEYFYTI